MKTKLVHVTLGPGRIAALVRESERKGISFEQTVQLAVEESLETASESEYGAAKK